MHLMCFLRKLRLTGQHTDVTLDKHLVKANQMIGEDLLPFSVCVQVHRLLFLWQPHHLLSVPYFLTVK